MSEADGRGQRVVVVTGGARAGGMGRAIAESFLRLGDAVVLSDVGAPLASHPDYEVAPPDHLSQAATELAVLGPVLPVACDVTDEEQVKALFDAEGKLSFDMETLRALEDALEDYAGCAVIISHDRWFLNRIATHILAFEGDSHVEWFEGNFADYEEDKKRRLGPDAIVPRRVKYKRLTR